MKKRKLIILAITIIAAALLLEGFILKYVNDKNSDRTSKVLLDRVITVLDKNDKSEEALIKSLKDDYIVRAKAVSYIIDAKPEVEYDVDELQKIAALISVDEIHCLTQKVIFTAVLCQNILVIALIPESRWHILNQCLRIRSLPCARTLRRILPRLKK